MSIYPKNYLDETDFERLGIIVNRLKKAVERDYYNCVDASDLHDDLLSAEHRLRMAERGLSK